MSMTTPRVTVPVEPTEAMMKAADAVDWNNEDERASVINMWQAMLSAAPAPEGGAVLADACMTAARSYAETGDDYMVGLLLKAGTILATPAEAGGRRVKSAAELQDECDRLADQFTDLYGAAKAVTLAAWTDRHGRLHGHEAVADLDRVLNGLTAQPPAREDAQPVAWIMRHMFGNDAWSNWTVVSEPVAKSHMRDHAFKIGRKQVIAVRDTHPAPDALRVAVEALEPFNRAYQAYLAAYANFMPSGATEAEQRFAEGERKDTAEEAAFEVLSKITLEQLCAVNEALAALQAEQKGGA